MQDFLSSAGLGSGNIIERAQFPPATALDKNRSPKRVFWKRGVFKKGPFSRDSRGLGDSRFSRFLEIPPESGKQMRIRPFSRDSRESRDSTDPSSEKTPSRNDLFFCSRVCWSWSSRYSACRGPWVLLRMSGTKVCRRFCASGTRIWGRILRNEFWTPEFLRRPQDRRYLGGSASLFGITWKVSVAILQGNCSL